MQPPRALVQSRQFEAAVATVAQKLAPDVAEILCTIGEEHGFIGSMIVIILFVSLLTRIVILAEKQRSKFARVYGYCVASIMFFHVLVNIGMTIGLMPVIGIPLPYFSYGGSSLWSFTLLLFIFLKLDSRLFLTLQVYWLKHLLKKEPNRRDFNLHRINQLAGSLVAIHQPGLGQTRRYAGVNHVGFWVESQAGNANE